MALSPTSACTAPVPLTSWILFGSNLNDRFIHGKKAIILRPGITGNGQYFWVWRVFWQAGHASSILCCCQGLLRVAYSAEMVIAFAGFWVCMKTAAALPAHSPPSSGPANHCRAWTAVLRGDTRPPSSSAESQQRNQEDSPHHLQPCKWKTSLKS